MTTPNQDVALRHPLAAYLEGRNKAAFARALGFKFTNNLYKYLPGRDGRPPARKITAKLAARIVAATNGELDYNKLLSAQSHWAVAA